MQLRPYQLDAANAALNTLRSGKNPAIMLATGTGKSLIAAHVAAHIARNSGRVWVMTHIQQLVAQNAATYSRYTSHAPGVVCAGLNRADYTEAVTFGTVQSMIAPVQNGLITPPDLIIIDEAHRVPHKTGETGLYQKIFAHVPAARHVGMTATPWRTDDGLIYGIDKDKFWFDTLAYKYTVPQAVADGWLSPLIGVETEHQLALEDLENTDFDEAEVTARQHTAWLESVAHSLSKLAAKRRYIAVYCPTLTAAMRTAAVLSRVTGRPSAILHGGMNRPERQRIFAQFERGEVQILCSIDTITTGWDFPGLDCIVCLRPLNSSSLWVQICGRGTRLAPGKRNCLLLDYVGNLQRLGGCDMLETYVKQQRPDLPIEAEPRPRRTPAKRELVPGVKTLKPIDPLTGAEARDGSELRLKVNRFNAFALRTRRNPAQPVLMVQYDCTTEENARISASLFVNTEKPTALDIDFIRRRRLALNLPVEARIAMFVVRDAPRPQHVWARKSGKYWTVTKEEM